MKARVRTLLAHPVVRNLLFERVLVTASAALALAALVTGRVRPSEIPGLLDARLLALFFVLTVAVELGKHSDLFDRLVAAVVRRARHARTLAFALIGVTGVSAALLTNDVALLLVVPFTGLFRKVAEVDLAPLVVLEIAAANLLGALTPIGNPQNLFLFWRGGFTPAGFLRAQAPFVAASAILLAACVPLLVPRRVFEPPETSAFGVDPSLAAAFGILLALAILAMSVGLIRSETASDLRTLTATGASGTTRRNLTAVTAGGLGFAGAVLGTVAAYVAAIGYAFDNKLDGLSELTSVPTTNLLLIVIGMPLAAAAVGWLFAGREQSALGRRPLE